MALPYLLTSPTVAARHLLTSLPLILSDHRSFLTFDPSYLRALLNKSALPKSPNTDVLTTILRRFHSRCRHVQDALPRSTIGHIRLKILQGPDFLQARNCLRGEALT